MWVGFYVYYSLSPSKKCNLHTFLSLFPIDTGIKTGVQTLYLRDNTKSLGEHSVKKKNNKVFSTDDLPVGKLKFIPMENLQILY